MRAAHDADVLGEPSRRHRHTTCGDLVQEGSHQMSANLTVYAMAFEAERPLRMREADQANRIALADASSGHRVDALLCRVGSAIRQTRGSGETPKRWTGIGNRASTVGQLAG